MNSKLITVLCSTLLCIQVWVEANLFTGLAGVEPLIETHGIVINHLDYYIVQEEKRLRVLKKNLELFKQEHTKALRDVTNYLGNPLNVFTLIKRLTSDLQNIERSVKLGTELIKDITSSQHAIYPTQEDLVGAAEALTRLQDTYKLNITELARGELNGITYSTPLTASDCFELGRALFNQYDYKNSLLWMMESLHKFKMEKEIHIVLNEEEILEYISFIYYEIGNFERAVHWNKVLLALSPNHPKALKNMPYYEYALNNNVINTGHVVEENNMYAEEMKKHKEHYEALCRGDLTLSPKVTKRLKCRYFHDNHPFLKIAPFKMEQLHINPDIFLFYDVINDDEVDVVINLAKPNLKRAKVHNNVERLVVKYRIAMSAWLSDEDSPVIERITQRVSDMTGLSMDSAENLQIGNYGIGGHYEPHYDFSLKTEIERDNRIATVLFYMSEVAQGGATVFTELGLSVFPVKNAAMFWMNLHPSGEGDLATRHAACPVLRGSKWVCNKWIHQSGQEFLKPCNLEYQEEGYSINYKRPVYKENYLN